MAGHFVYVEFLAEMDVLQLSSAGGFHGRSVGFLRGCHSSRTGLGVAPQFEALHFTHPSASDYV